MAALTLYSLVVWAITQITVTLTQYDPDLPRTAIMGDTVVQIYKTVGYQSIRAILTDVLDVRLPESPPKVPSEYANASEMCQDCLKAVDLGNLIIDLGFEFEDLRDVGVGVCVDYFNQTSPAEVIICPGAVDIHAYHLFRTFKERHVSSEQACTIYNYCLESKLNPSVDQEPYQKPPTPLNQGAEKQIPSSGMPPDGSLKVLHLSDIHVDLEYLEGSAVDCGLMVCCRPYWPGGGVAGRWGESVCNTPPSTINALLQQLHTLHPDIVIYSGDNGPHSFWNESIAGQKRCSSFIAEQFTRHFPTVPVFSSIGNHESFPTNHYKLGLAESREFNEGFTEWWKGVSRFTPEQEATIRKGAYYTILARPGLRILTYNSQYGHTGNLYVVHTINDQDYADMKKFMVDTLAAAKEADEKVIMISHHPTGTHHTTVEFSRFLTSLCNNHSDIIVLHVFGHWHRDEFRLFIDKENGRATGVQTMMSAVTPRGGNPTARMLYLHPQEFTLTDYDNYYMDIGPQVTGRPRLDFMYRFTREYNMTDASPESFRLLTERMRQDDSVLDTFWSNSRGRTGREGRCTGACKREFLCRLTNTVYDQYVKCNQ